MKQGTMSEAIKQVVINQLKQETLEEADKKSFGEIWSTLTTEQSDYLKGFINRQREDAKKWQQEQIGKSEFLQKLRGTVSDAEARRLIFETFKKK